MKSILILLFSFPTLAWSEKVVLDSIQVRGHKENKNYLDTPESVTVLQEKDMAVFGRENSLQALNAVPNVEVNKNGESLSIRGINSTGVTGYQKDNLSSLVVDDLFQTDLAIQAGSFHLWDVDRIEVLRGAQSTQQGVNSLAGTILLDHRRPQFTEEGAIKLGLGSFGHFDLGGMVNHVWSNSKLATRMTFDQEKNDGYITNISTGNKQWGAWNKTRISANTAYKIAEDEQIEIYLKLNRSKQGGVYSQGSDAFQYEVSEDQDYLSTTQNYQSVMKYEKKWKRDLSQISILGFSQSRQDTSSDADGTSQNTAGTRFEKHTDHYLNFENRLHMQMAQSQNLLGVHLHEFQAGDDYDFNLLYPIGAGLSTPVAVLQNVSRRQRVFALFDTFTYDLNSSHSLTLGARGEYVESKYGTDVTGRRTQDLGSGNTSIDQYLAAISGAYEGKNEGAVILPKLSYLYKQEQQRWGLSYTRGYRTSGVGINRRKATAHQYEAEYTNNYEASYKYISDLFQGATHLFYIDWRDQQVQVQLSNDFYDTEVINAARSEVYGGEIEGKLKINSFQSLSLGLGYSDTKFKNFQTRNGDYAGKKFPFAAHWTGRLTYELMPMEDLTLTSVGRYVGDSYSNAENTRKSEAQFYVNLAAKYAWQAWVLEAYVNNLLDGKYRIFDGTPTSSTSPYQASYHQTGAPREMGLKANYFW